MSYDVIVVGAGLTGAAVARDCALRGLRTLLLEDEDIGCGASTQGMCLLDLGSLGANPRRRASAAAELAVLNQNAGHLLHRTPVLWPTSVDRRQQPRRWARHMLHTARAQLREPGDQPRLWARLEGDEARELEPALSPAIAGAILGTAWQVDLSRLTVLLVRSAIEAGAELQKGVRAVAIERVDGRVTGVRCLDKLTGSERFAASAMVVNAAGAGIAALDPGLVQEGVVRFARATWLRFSQRLSCATLVMPGAAEGAWRIISGPGTSVLGPWLVPSAPTQAEPEPHSTDVARLLERAREVLPDIDRDRLVEAWASTLACAVDAPALVSGWWWRTRRPAILHGAERGTRGLFTIVGGAAVEHRLVAQRVTDVVCQQLGNDARCITAESPLLGTSGTADHMRWAAQFPVPPDVAERLAARHGVCAHEILMLAAEGSGGGAGVVCSCQGISTAELRHAVTQEEASSLADLERRTGLGRGTCQGARCLTRAARGLREAGGTSAAARLMELLTEKNRRLRRYRPVLDGPQAAVFELDQLAHGLTGNLGWYWQCSEAVGADRGSDG